MVAVVVETTTPRLVLVELVERMLAALVVLDQETLTVVLVEKILDLAGALTQPAAIIQAQAVQE